MFFIIKAFFLVIAFFFFLTIITGLSLVLRVRQVLRNPFLKPGMHNPSPPPGNGDIIEGEFKVLDEKQQ